MRVSTSKPIQLVDITDQIEYGPSGKAVLVYTPHTTCAIMINENESGLVKDFESYLSDLISDRKFLHDRIDNNGGSHILGGLLGPSVVIPIVNGRLGLGTWQRVFLVELDGPRNREVICVTL